jgi:hypothetical protein
MGDNYLVKAKADKSKVDGLLNMLDELKDRIEKKRLEDSLYQAGTRMADCGTN